MKRWKAWWKRIHCQHHDIKNDVDARIVFCEHCGLSRYYTFAEFQPFKRRMTLSGREHELER